MTKFRHYACTPMDAIRLIELLRMLSRNEVALKGFTQHFKDKRVVIIEYVDLETQTQLTEVS